MKKRQFISSSLSLAALASSPAFLGCKSEIEDAVDIVDGVPRKTIPKAVLGVNAFVNDSRFGSISSQFEEVRDVLGIRRVRILFNWDNNVQPTAVSNRNFNFYDAIVSAIPNGLDVMAVLTGIPNWVRSSPNPRREFVDSWVAPVIARYGGSIISSYQIWNEPNMEANDQNQIMGWHLDASRYVEMLADAYPIVKAGGARVVTAATTAIAQNYPDSVDYNRAMRDAGAQDYADIWAIHFYGRQYENIVRKSGVADFVNGLRLPVWCTESGNQGVNEQLAYGEQAWPYMLEQMPGIQRIYIYQFTEASDAAGTYGLRNLSSTLPVSDLYVWLRDN